MKKFEYKIFNMSECEPNANNPLSGISVAIYPHKNMLEWFEELGAEGWELKMKLKERSFIFMREIQQ